MQAVGCRRAWKSLLIWREWSASPDTDQGICHSSCTQGLRRQRPLLSSIWTPGHRPGAHSPSPLSVLILKSAVDTQVLLHFPVRSRALRDGSDQQDPVKEGTDEGRRQLSPL